MRASSTHFSPLARSSRRLFSPLTGFLAAVVLATGSRPGTHWAPPGLADDPRLVADPWTQPIPEDGDVLSPHWIDGHAPRRATRWVRLSS